MKYNSYSDAIRILATEEFDTPSYYKESENIKVILEDSDSPITRKYQEKLYNQVLKKGHINFGDIPASKGNIKNYSGYNTMCETLRTIKSMATESKANDVVKYVEILETAINNISSLSSTYEKGFMTRTEYVGLEYDMYVYLCVEATTALLYSFVEVVKSPDKTTLDMTIKNTKLRADEFYFEQLKKFNTTQKNMGIEYRKMLESMCNKDKSNFVGAEIVGIGTIIAVAMSIIPISREVIYQIYSLRGNLADNLEMQANFLDLNKSCVENNEIMTEDKKRKILAKQEKLSKKLQTLANKIRVKSSKSIMDSKRELNKDNRMLTIDNIKDEISNSPLELI